MEVGVTEIQRNFSDYINRVSYREESFLLIRGGRPVAHLTPVPSGPALGDLPDLVASLPPLGRREAGQLTAELGWGRARDEPEPPAVSSDSDSGEAPNRVGDRSNGGGSPESAGERSGTRDEEAESGGVGPAGDGPDSGDGGEEPEGGAPLLLDAVLLLDHQAGHADLAARVVNREEAPFHLSVITVGELYRVADRTRNPIRRGVRLRWVDAVAERFPLLAGDLDTARSHASLWGRLSNQGVRLSPHDLWLTAACVAHGLTLATSDPLRFQGLSGLRIEDWGPPGEERPSKPG